MKDKIIGLTVVASVFLLIGCAPSTPPPTPYKLRPSPDVKTLSVEELCSLQRSENWYEIYRAENPGYGTNTTKATAEQINVLKQEVVDAKAELKRRKPFTRREMNLIKNREVQVGMSKKALLCSWGSPDRINRSSYGPDQYVYEGSSYDNSYVYLKGNRVSDWSQ